MGGDEQESGTQSRADGQAAVNDRRPATRTVAAHPAASAMAGTSQMAGIDSPATTYTPAHATIPTEAAGRSDHPIRPTRPESRAAHT